MSTTNTTPSPPVSLNQRILEFAQGLATWNPVFLTGLNESRPRPYREEVIKIVRNALSRWREKGFPQSIDELADVAVLVPPVTSESFVGVLESLMDEGWQCRDGRLVWVGYDANGVLAVDDTISDNQNQPIETPCVKDATPAP